MLSAVPSLNVTISLIYSGKIIICRYDRVLLAKNLCTLLIFPRVIMTWGVFMLSSFFFQLCACNSQGTSVFVRTEVISHLCFSYPSSSSWLQRLLATKRPHVMSQPQCPVLTESTVHPFLLGQSRSIPQAQANKLTCTFSAYNSRSQSQVTFSLP